MKSTQQNATTTYITDQMRNLKICSIERRQGKKSNTRSQTRSQTREIIRRETELPDQDIRNKHQTKRETVFVYLTPRYHKGSYFLIF